MNLTFSNSIPNFIRVLRPMTTLLTTPACLLLWILIIIKYFRLNVSSRTGLFFVTPSSTTLKISTSAILLITHPSWALAFIWPLSKILVSTMLMSISLLTTLFFTSMPVPTRSITVTKRLPSLLLLANLVSLLYPKMARLKTNFFRKFLYDFFAKKRNNTSSFN